MPEYMPEDKPRTEIMQLAEETLKRYDGHARVYFKFTCEHCGQRCTFAEPNNLYTSGQCVSCNKQTAVRQAGFLLVLLRRRYDKDPREERE